MQLFLTQGKVLGRKSLWVVDEQAEREIPGENRGRKEVKSGNDQIT